MTMPALLYTAIDTAAGLPHLPGAADATGIDEVAIPFDPNSMLMLRIIVAGILFGIALDTSIDDFKRAATRPKAILIGVGAQFLILPALTFVLTLLLGVRGSIALGMILVACCPPGNVSNIVTHQARGDVALSVSMTAVSNLLAIVLMPLTFAFWGSLHPTGRAVMATVDIDALDMLVEVVLVIGVPFALGIAVARLWPRAASRSSRFVGPIAFVALGVLVGVALVNNLGLFLSWIGIAALAVFLHDSLALALGYGIARVFRLPTEQTKAMTFEVGIRNASLGLLLVFSFFGGLGGMALVVAWWGVWDIVQSLAIARAWRRRGARTRLGPEAAGSAATGG